MTNNRNDHFEPDTYIEGEETLAPGELTRVLEASVRNMEASLAGKGERRVTYVAPSGEFQTMTQTEYRANILPGLVSIMPKIDYNTAEDAVTIFLSNNHATIYNSDEPRENVVFNYDFEGRLVYIELLHASRMVNLAQLFSESDLISFHKTARNQS